MFPVRDHLRRSTITGSDWRACTACSVFRNRSAARIVARECEFQRAVVVEIHPPHAVRDVVLVHERRKQIAERSALVLKVACVRRGASSPQLLRILGNRAMQLESRD